MFLIFGSKLKYGSLLHMFMTQARFHVSEKIFCMTQDRTDIEAPFIPSQFLKSFDVRLRLIQFIKDMRITESGKILDE